MGHSTTDTDEDGDEQWRAAVNSVALDSATVFTNGSHRAGTKHPKVQDNEGESEGKSSNLKLCQARAQDLLHGYLDKTLVIMADPESQTQLFDLATTNADDDIRLFRRAPLGISFKPVVNAFPGSLPRKKPRIYPRYEIDEKSTKFQSQLESVAVDGAVILATAERENARTFAKMQAKAAAALAAEKREEERVALLKQQRGEKWLPAIAREMFGNTDLKTNNMQIQPKAECKRLSNNARLHKK